MMDFTQIGVNWVIEAILQKWVPYSRNFFHTLICAAQADWPMTCPILKFNQSRSACQGGSAAGGNERFGCYALFVSCKLSYCLTIISAVSSY